MAVPGIMPGIVVYCAQWSMPGRYFSLCVVCIYWRGHCGRWWRYDVCVSGIVPGIWCG